MLFLTDMWINAWRISALCYPRGRDFAEKARKNLVRHCSGGSFKLSIWQIGEPVLLMLVVPKIIKDAE